MEKKKLIKQNSNCILPSPLNNGISISYRGLPLHILMNRYTTKFTANTYLDATMIILILEADQGQNRGKFAKRGHSENKQAGFGVRKNNGIP